MPLSTYASFGVPTARWVWPVDQAGTSLMRKTADSRSR